MTRSALFLLLLGIGISMGGCRKKEESSPCPVPVEGKGDFRLFAMGVTVDLSLAVDIPTLKRKFLSSIEPLLPCLDPSGKNIVVYPEDVGLILAFLGPRGEIARQQTTSENAFVSLALSYGIPMRGYQKIYPEISDNRALTLALGHTIYSGVFQIFPEIARKTKSLTIVSVNAPYPFTYTEDPLSVETFGYPELGVKGVYKAVTSSVYNLSLFFTPDGNLSFVDPKRYLVPAEEDLLDLSYGDISRIGVFPYKNTLIGSVISKDAWMPDVLERLSDLSAQVLVQPEAFSGWTIGEVSEEEWLPDVFMESSYTAVQIYPPFLYSVVPMLIGNLFELPFDGQSHITKKAEGKDPLLAFVGNDPVRGWVSMGPWSFPDPKEENPSLPKEERRRKLRELGKSLLPSGERANQYRNSSAFGKVVLREDGGYPYGKGEKGEGIYSFSPVEAPDGTVWVVYTTWDGKEAFLKYGAFSGDAFHEKGIITKNRYPTFHPSVVLFQNTIAGVFSAGEEGKEKIYFFTIDPRTGLLSQEPKPIDPSPSYQWWPSLKGDGNRLYLAYVDGREGFSGVYFSRGDLTSWEPPRRVDGKNPEGLRGPRKNSFFPAVTIDGIYVAITFSDFRNYTWDGYLVLSRDGGTTFSLPVSFNGGNRLFERIVRWSEPRFHRGALHIVYHEIRNRKPDPDLYYTSTTNGTDFSSEIPLSPPLTWEGKFSYLMEDGNLLLTYQRSREDIRVEVFSFRPGQFPEKIVEVPETPSYNPVLLSTREGKILLYLSYERGFGELKKRLLR